MKRNFRIFSGLTMIVLMASCTSSQFGYDDVYDHDYPVAVAKTNAEPTNSSAQNNYYENQSNYREYNAYQEEDYNSYNNGYNSNGGFYSDRINRFFTPSFSIGFFSPGFSTFGFGGNSYFNQNYFYNPSPFFGFNSYFSDPYDWHIHHYHHSQLWGNNWGFNNYNPWYGYGNNNYYCPPNYGYSYGYSGYNNPFYSPFYSPYYGINNSDGNQNNSNNSNVNYGPRSNYQSSGISAQPTIQTTFGTDGQPQEVIKSYSNGVKVNTQFKPVPNTSPAPLPTEQTNPSNTPPKKNNDYSAPVVTPRPSTPPSSAPKPIYNNPSPSETPKPRPSYTSPKPTVNPTPKSESPKINPNSNSGVKVKTTPK
jgi:hypothetical protein